MGGSGLSPNDTHSHTKLRQWHLLCSVGSEVRMSAERMRLSFFFRRGCSLCVSVGGKPQEVWVSKPRALIFVISAFDGFYLHSGWFGQEAGKSGPDGSRFSVQPGLARGDASGRFQVVVFLNALEIRREGR